MPFLSSFRIGELLDGSSGEELPATAVPFDAASEQAMEEQKCVFVCVCVCVCPCVCVCVCVCVCGDTMNYHNSAKLVSKSFLTHLLDLSIDPSITTQIPNM